MSDELRPVAGKHVAPEREGWALIAVTVLLAPVVWVAVFWPFATVRREWLGPVAAGAMTAAAIGWLVPTRRWAVGLPVVALLQLSCYALAVLLVGIGSGSGAEQLPAWGAATFLGGALGIALLALAPVVTRLVRLRSPWLRVVPVAALILLAYAFSSYQQRDQLLAHAAHRGDSAAAEWYLSVGADPSSALWSAADAGNTEVVEMLLARGAPVDAKGGMLGTPLYAAVMKRHPDTALLLLKHGADPNATVPYLGNTVLHLAAKEGQAEVVAALVAAGADVKARSSVGTGVSAPPGTLNEGFTALHWAADRGDAATAGLLLTHGAEVDAQTTLGYTPLHRAAGRKNTGAAIAVLLDHGADPDAKEKEYGRTPLHWAARFGDAESVTLLLKRGAKPGLRGARFGFTPLHEAAIEGKADTVAVLLAAGAPVNTNDKQGKTALDWAVEKHHAEVEALLRGHR